MTTIRNYHPGPRAWAAIFLALVVVLLGEFGLIIKTYEQGQTQTRQGKTQHQICQLITFFGDQTQHGIDTNSALIRHDLKVGTKNANADIAIRRVSISKASSLLIKLNQIHC